MSEYITLKENRDFSRIYRRGKSFVSPVLVTYVQKNKSGAKRYGITTGKKVGKAVSRTRARREDFRSVSAAERRPCHSVRWSWNRRCQR